MATKKKTTTKTSRSTASRRTSAKQKKENQELKDIILAVILLAITLVAYRRMGIVGEMLNNGLRFLLGRFYYLVVGVVILQIIITLINRYSGNTLSRNPLAIVLLILGFLLLVSLIDTPKSLHGTEIYLNYVDDVMAYFSSNPAEAIGGGLIDALLLTATTLLVDRTGTIVILVADAVIVLLLLVSLNVYKQAFHTIVEYFSTNAEDEDDLVEDDVPEEEKKRRLNEIMDLQDEIVKEDRVRLIGEEAEVLVEEIEPLTGMYLGRSAMFAPDAVDGWVRFRSEEALEPGTFCRVRYTRVSGQSLLAEYLEKLDV